MSIFDQINRSILPQMPDNGPVISRPPLKSGCKANNSVGISNINVIDRAAAAQGITGQGAEVGAIYPNGTSDQGQTITIVASPINIFPTPQYVSSEGGVLNGGAGYASGPIVGIARFQNGGADSDIIEFDVPLVGGTVLTLPTSVAGISFRDDGALIPGFTAFSPAMFPIGVPGDIQQLRTWAVYGTRAPSQLFKTQWFATPTGGAGAGGLGVGQTNRIMIPRYAKSFRPNWFPLNNAGIDITIIGSMGQPVMGPYVLPAGTTLTPDFFLPDVGVYVDITARTAAVSRGLCIFTLGL